MTEVKLIVGPPGTGKTTALSREVEARAEEYDGRDIAVCSLTKTAAKEIGSRVDIPDENVGTLHSHAFRALDRPDLAETPEGRGAWNAAYPDQRLTGAGQATKDELDGPGGQADDDGPGGADDLHQQVMNQRARMAPISELPAAAQAHHQRWQDFKAQTQRLDFTDLIEQALSDTGQHPAIPRTLLGDEAQDFSALELALFRHWARAAETVVLAADPLQAIFCQPAGTLVTVVTKRYSKISASELQGIPIEHVKPGDRVVSYNATTRRLRRSGSTVTHAEARGYTGRLISVTTDNGQTSRFTEGHHCLIRWDRQALKEAWLVYMMRRDGRYRVGCTAAVHTCASGRHGLALRITQELADAAWIVGIYSDQATARAAECTLQGKWALPGRTFQKSSPTRTQNDLDAQWATFGEADASRARAALEGHGLDAGDPLWSRGHPVSFRKSLIVTARNLTLGMKMLPLSGAQHTPEGKGVPDSQWLPVAISREAYTGSVISLSVEGDHTYFADGLLTHNSWRGADPHAFDRVDAAHTRVLRQSYRMSGAVHAAAVGWARSQGLTVPDYRPTEATGQVSQSSHSLRWPEPVVAELADDGSSTVILATCSYMLGPMVAALRDAGVPFHNPLRPDHGGWNPLRGGRRLAAFLRPDERVWGDRARAWTWADLKAFCEPLNARTALTRGAKNYITEKCKTDKFGVTAANDEAPLDVVASMFTEARPDVAIRHPALRMDVDWWAENLLGSQADRMRYPLDIYRRRGGQALIETPRVAIGTVHSYKGGEADHVVLAPDLSKAAMYGGWLGAGEARDHIVRTLYVGLSRARESVTVLAPSTAERVDGLLGAEQALVGAA